MTDQNNFRYQTFVAGCRSHGGEVPVVDDVLSSDEQEIYPTTSLDANSIEFEFQTDRNVYVHLRQLYFALKMDQLKGLVLILTEQQKRKRNTMKTVFTGTGNDDVKFLHKEVEGVPLLLMWTLFHTHLFRMRNCIIKTTKSTNRMD